MEREEFLKSLGISFASVCIASCLSACSKDETTKPDETPPPVEEPPLPAGTVTAKFTDFTVVGSRFIVDKVLFIKIEEGNLASSFIAMYRFCPHENGDLYWNKGMIDCIKHRAAYDKNGAILSQPKTGSGTTKPLKMYPITVTATHVNAKTS